MYRQCRAGDPTLALTKDTVISVPGRSGTMVAIRPGGSGDVSGKQKPGEYHVQAAVTFPARWSLGST